MGKVKEILKRVKFIYIPWHNFRLYLNEKKEEKKRTAYKKYGVHVLKLISRIVMENNYKIAPTEGTLLGLIRDSGLIPWDDDLDFLILDDGNISWTDIEAKLIENGFWKYREKYSNGKLLSQAYKYKNVHCDFVLWPLQKEKLKIDYGCYEYKDMKYENNKEAEYQVWEIEVPAVNKLEYRNIGGMDILVPNNSEELLTGIYGDWKKPDPNYKPQRIEIRKKFKFIYFTKSGKIKKHF